MTSVWMSYHLQVLRLAENIILWIVYVKRPAAPLQTNNRITPQRFPLLWIKSWTVFSQKVTRPGGPPGGSFSSRFCPVQSARRRSGHPLRTLLPKTTPLKPFQPGKWFPRLSPQLPLIVAAIMRISRGWHDLKTALIIGPDVLEICGRWESHGSPGWDR